MKGGPSPTDSTLPSSPIRIATSVGASGPATSSSLGSSTAPTAAFTTSAAVSVGMGSGSSTPPRWGSEGTATISVAWVSVSQAARGSTIVAARPAAATVLLTVRLARGGAALFRISRTSAMPSMSRRAPLAAMRSFRSSAKAGSVAAPSRSASTTSSRCAAVSLLTLTTKSFTRLRREAWCPWKCSSTWCSKSTCMQR